jgi:hypothetical protein
LLSENPAFAAAPPTTSSLQDYTPEELEKHLEEAELQILVDKYAFKDSHALRCYPVRECCLEYLSATTPEGSM